MVTPLGIRQLQLAMAIYGHDVDSDGPVFGLMLSEILELPRPVVYTVLRWLASEGYVDGQMESRKGLPRRPRRHYQLTPAGVAMVEEWLALAMPGFRPRSTRSATLPPCASVTC